METQTEAGDVDPFDPANFGPPVTEVDFQTGKALEVIPVVPTAASNRASRSKSTEFYAITKSGLATLLTSGLGAEAVALALEALRRDRVGFGPLLVTEATAKSLGIRGRQKRRKAINQLAACGLFKVDGGNGKASAIIPLTGVAGCIWYG